MNIEMHLGERCEAGPLRAVPDHDLTVPLGPATEQQSPLRDVAAKTLLFCEGEAGSGLTLLVAGCVALTRSLGDGRRQIVDVLGPDELFGVEASAAHDCSAEAVTPLRLRAIRWDESRQPQLAGALLRGAGKALARQRDHAFLLGRKSARERVASGILRLDEVLGAGTGRFHCPLTRQDLGDWLGLALETVSRALSGLQRDGVIALGDHGAFEILDRSRLAAAAAAPPPPCRTARA